MAACAPAIVQAPFPARPDTVFPGDLLGAFDGRVLDAQSGKPLAGAIVQASWAFETGRGLTAPAGGAVTTVATDNDGRYAIDRLADLPSPRARVVGVTLVVYQRGYVAYRSDRIFDALGGARARTDFAQHMNVVKLDRWSGALSHVKHVRFVGGSGALKRALGSEVVEASLELTSGPKKPAAKAAVEPAKETAPPLDAGVLLSVDELRAVTGYSGDLTVEKLTDLPTTSSYDSRHFKAAGKPETFDAAVRAWKLAPDAADARFAKLLAEVPHAERRDEMGAGSLRGFDGRILAVAALDHEKGVVIEFTCGLDQCRDADQAAAILKRMLARADRLGQPAPPSAEEEKPTEPATPAPAKSEPPKSQEPKTEEPKTEEPEENQFKLKPPELRR